MSLNGVTNGSGAGGPAVDTVSPYYFTSASPTSLAVDLPGYSVTSLVVY